MVELVADSIVLHTGADDVLKAIVVTLDFESARDDGLHPVVVAHDLNLVNDSVLTWTGAGRAALGKDLVVVARDQQVRDGVASANLYLAVMASKHYRV